MQNAVAQAVNKLRSAVVTSYRRTRRDFTWAF
jgi:hypothetical protein